MTTEHKNETCGICKKFEYNTLDELAAHVYEAHTPHPKQQLPKHQRKMIKFVMSNHRGITREQLDPANNEMNSVRLQQLRVTGHAISEGWEDRKCNICGEIIKEYVCHYYDWSESRKVTRSVIKRNDNPVIGAEGFARHMFEKHPEETAKRLGKIGVRVIQV